EAVKDQARGALEPGMDKGEPCLLGSSLGCSGFSSGRVRSIGEQAGSRGPPLPRNRRHHLHVLPFRTRAARPALIVASDTGRVVEHGAEAVAPMAPAIPGDPLPEKELPAIRLLSRWRRTARAQEEWAQDHPHRERRNAKLAREKPRSTHCLDPPSARVLS